MTSVQEGSGEYPTLWLEIWQQYYDVCFQDLMLDRLVNRWLHVDITFRYLIAITASGSAVSGWVFWSYPGASLIWTILSSAAALVSVIYGVIPISSLIKDGTKAHSEASALRTRFDTFLVKYRTDRGSNESAHKKELFQLMKIFTGVCDKSPRFPFTTDKFTRNVQERLNAELASKNLIDNSRELLNENSSSKKQLNHPDAEE